MTKIVYENSRTEFKVKIQGHSGYSAVGTDIVCAAISILIQTLIARIEEVADRYESEMDEGFAYAEAEGIDAVGAFRTILVGFELMADNYPDYVSLEKGVL